MKKSIILAAACVVAAGCAKEGFETASRKFVPVTMEIGAPSTKIALDGTTGAQTWVAGDEIGIWSYFKDSENVYHDYISKLTASASGASSGFTGTADAELFTFPSANNYVISPYSAATSYYTNSVYITVPAAQTGKLSDFGKYAVAYSKVFKLVKQADDSYAFPAGVSKLYNLTPAIKFNIASGLDVRKIVISGFMGGVQQLLVAQKSDGKALQFKPGTTPQIYKTNTSIKELTIERAGSEEINGDVYGILAPNFPQTSDGNNVGWQWEDGRYDINDSTKIAFNSCDSLAFVFYDSKGGKVEFGKKLTKERILRVGTIVDLGNITSLPFPAPEIKLSVGTSGNLMCTPPSEGYTYVYEMTSDGSTPSDVTVSSNAFPTDGLEFSEGNTTYEVKIKVGQVKNGAVLATKNVLFRKYNAPSTSTSSKSIMPGASLPLGFMSFNNFWIDPDGNHENEVKGSLSSGAGVWTYKCYKLDATGLDTAKDDGGSALTYAAKGIESSPFKTSFTFNVIYSGADCALYTKAGKATRKMTLKYVEGATVLKAPSTSSTSTVFQAPDNRLSWATGVDLQVKTVVGNGIATLFIFTDSTSFEGFAWLEQGFKSF